MPITNRANRKNFSIGLAPQSAKGTAAAHTAARWIAATEVSTDASPTAIHPQGTTGSLFFKDTHRNVVREPKINFSALGSREFVGPLLEMLSFGLPTVSGSELTEQGDTNSVLSSWSLTGVRPGFNTEYTSAGSIIYVKIQSNQILLYRDAAMTMLVAQGNCSVGTVTLTEQNSSGLSGTVSCSSATPADDLDITLTIHTVTLNWSTQIQCYWTTFIWDGNKLRTYRDCVLQSLRGRSEHAGALSLQVALFAVEEAVTSDTPTPSIPMNTPYAHNGDLVFRRNINSTPIIENPINCEVMFERDLQAIIGTAAAPQDFFSGLITVGITADFEPGTETNTMIATVDSFDEIDVKYTVGSKVLAFVFNKAKLINPNYSTFSGDRVPPITLSWSAMEETAASPGAAVAITYQP